MRWFLGLRSLVLVVACAAMSAGCRHPPHPPELLIGREIQVQFPGEQHPHRAMIGRRALLVHEGETALGLVDTAGLARNADAIELIRALNPGVEIYDLRPGATVIIPDLGRAPTETVTVFVDDVRKRVVREAITAVLAHADDLPPDGASFDIASILRDIVGRIDKRMLVTTPQFLDLVRAEAELFGKLVTTPSPLRLLALASQLREQTASFFDQHKGDLPADHDRVTIDVRVFRRHGSAAPVEVHNEYRVWYSAKVLFDEHDLRSGVQIGGLAPAGSELSPGGYVFWATDGSVATPRRGTLPDVHLKRGEHHVRVDIVFDEDAR